MKTPFLTPKQAEAWRAAQRVATPQIDAPQLSAGLLKTTLTLLGAVALGLLGWAIH